MIKQLKERKHDALAIFALLLIVFAFFFRLFYPHVSLFITPEFNMSDITDLNIPIKSILWHAYRLGEIPLWEKSIGTGFPLFAETQIGYFFIPNILIYSIFPFDLAFNLGYVTALFMTASGFYVYMRLKRFKPLISFFAGFTFAFSGFYMGHLNQYNMLQAASLLPWLLVIFELIRLKITLPRILVFSIVLSQQIFAGHAQITFITLCTIAASYTIDLIFPFKWARQHVKTIIVLTVILLIGIVIASALSAVLLLPTIELTKIVSRPQNWDLSHATFYSFPFKQFLGYLSPFIFGSPRLGTFSPQDQFNGLLFWENVAYIGIIPFFLSVVFWVRNIKLRKIIVFSTFIAIFAILMLGKFSPVNFIFSFPQLNVFRVTSRFILPVTLGVVTIFAFALKDFETRLKKQLPLRTSQFVVIILLLATVCDIFYNWYSYNLTENAKVWLSDPIFAQEIKKDGNTGRVITFNAGNERASIYTAKGWTGVGDYYTFDRNELIEDSNATWGITQFGLYTGLYTLNRYAAYDKALVDTIT